MCKTRCKVSIDRNIENEIRSYRGTNYKLNSPLLAIEKFVRSIQHTLKANEIAHWTAESYLRTNERSFLFIGTLLESEQFRRNGCYKSQDSRIVIRFLLHPPPPRPWTRHRRQFPVIQDRDERNVDRNLFNSVTSRGPVSLFSDQFVLQPIDCGAFLLLDERRCFWIQRARCTVRNWCIEQEGNTKVEENDDAIVDTFDYLLARMLPWAICLKISFQQP